MKLVLSNGSEFSGKSSGAAAEVVGEVIFNTSMVGYQELLSDPSYAGQIVVMTYPLIGQYGITDEDFESKATGPAGIIAREICDTPSNFRCTATISEYFEMKGVPCLSAVDTRQITKIIRDNSPIYGALVPDDKPTEEALRMIEGRKENEVTLSCRSRWFSRTPHHLRDVVVIDCGLKRSIISELNKRGCNVTVVPSCTGAEEILSFKPKGVLISSGPGNPEKLKTIIETINGLKGKVPICGIGLGQQLIGLSYGAKVRRIGCGHHGGMPVRDLATGRIFTAEHNNCYVLDLDSVKATGLKVTYLDVADGTVDGIESEKDKVFSSEFTAEGAPGPQESNLFDKFIKLMEG